MNVLFLTSNPNLGSTARVLQAWGVRVAGFGVRCQVVCPPGELAEELERAGVEVLRSACPLPDRRRPWLSAWEALRVAWWARNASVVHCNEHTVYPFGAIVGRLLRKPVVCYVRFKLTRDFCTWAFGRYGAPAALLWTSYSQQRESAAAVAGLVPEGRQLVLRLGLDTGRFGSQPELRCEARRQLGVDENTVVLGSASAIKPIKQLEDFIECVRRVRQRHSNVIGVIAGGVAPGYEQYAAELKQRTETPEFEPSIRWVGHQRNIEPFLYGIDVFISTSDLETFGNSVCEAMLCGNPVVAYEGGAVAEVVGDAGSIVSNGDLDGLTAQVLRLLDRPSEAARLGMLGRLRVQREFDAVSRIPQLLEVYERVRSDLPLQRQPDAGLESGENKLPAKQQPVRVLYLTINPNRASTTVPTEGWMRELRSKGLEPVLVSHQAGDFHRWAVEQGIPAYHEPLPLPSKWYPWPFVRALWRLQTIVQRHGIQLIHCNEQNCYPIGSYLAKLTGLPITVSVHFTVGRAFCKWAFGKHVPMRVFFVSAGNLQSSLAGVDGIVPRAKWRILHNALDLKHYQPDPHLGERFRKEHRLDGHLVIGVACALRERKQVEHLLRLAQSLPSEVHVALAGGPVPEEQRYAEALVAMGQSALGSRFHYLGHLNDLRPFCNALTLFINTSREEAFGIAAAEAMACGCPVIGYPSKAVDTVVLPGGGEITPQDDIEALAAAIQRWLNDPERLAAARVSARKRVESAFDIRVVAQQLLDDYHAVLAEFSGRMNSAAAQHRLLSEHAAQP